MDPLVFLCQHFSVLTIMAPLSVLISGKPICIHFQDVLVGHYLFQKNYRISLARSKYSDVSVGMFIRICMYPCISMCIYSCVCVYVAVRMDMLVCGDVSVYECWYLLMDMALSSEGP